MVQTNKKKRESREARLKSLPLSERLLKSALIKKKEGRVLDASEKHALKMHSENGEILRLWEKLRATTTTTSAEEKSELLEDEQKKPSVTVLKATAYEDKYPLVSQLVKLIKPKFSTQVRTPTISRVLQSMLKYGSQNHVNIVASWVADEFLSCATDAYGYFVVIAIVRHSTRETFQTIFGALLPVVSQLINHKFGAQVIHSVYSSRWCSSDNRNLILLAVFKDDVAVMRRWDGYPVLEKVLALNKPIQKRLLTRLFDLVEKLISQKEAIDFPFVQRLAHAFLLTGTREEVSELCETLRPYVATTLALSREGSSLASLVFSLTHPKKKKDVLRDVHANLGILTTNKYSAPFICRLFDFLYDGQLQLKYLVGDMIEHIGQIINNEYGYRILMHLLTPDVHRKERFLFPYWISAHNLFSEQNAEWNHHTWLTGDYEPEQVEICSKPAMSSHLLSLPALVRSFLDYATAEKSSRTLNRYHASLVAREVLLVVDSYPAYKAALLLDEREITALQKLSPASGASKRERDCNTGIAHGEEHENVRMEEEDGTSSPRKHRKKEGNAKKIKKECSELPAKSSKASEFAKRKTKRSSSAK